MTLFYKQGSTNRVFKQDVFPSTFSPWLEYRVFVEKLSLYIAYCLALRWKLTQMFQGQRSILCQMDKKNEQKHILTYIIIIEQILKRAEFRL